MLRAVEGVFRDGRVELREIPEDIREARVIVTFLAEPELAPSAEAKNGSRPGAELRSKTAWEHLKDNLEEDSSQKESTREPPPPAAERLRAFRALVASLPEAPAVPLAAFDREDLYP